MSYTISPQRRKRRGAYFICETCGKEFYVMPCHIKQHQQKGSKIRFCTMKCYDKTGDKNPFWGKKHTPESKDKFKNNPNRPKFGFGKDNPNFIRYGEDYGFKGSHYLWWKNKLLKDIGQCEICSFNKKHILQLHHIDRCKK